MMALAPSCQKVPKVKIAKVKNPKVKNLLYMTIIYDQPNNESFCSKVERIQYNAALAVTGAIRGTSQPKLYN